MTDDWTELEEESQRILIERYSPAGFLVDADLNIVSLLGDTSTFLQPRSGRPSFSLTRMLNRKLLPYVQAAVDASSREGTVRHESSVDELGLRMKIEVTQISTSTQRQAGFLIFLQRESIPSEAEPRRSQEEWSRLRTEGQLMRNSVTSVVEQKHAIKTELEQTRAELNRTREDLRRVLGQTLLNHEEEHRLLARELHGVLSQKIAALGLELDTLASQSDELPNGIFERIAGAIRSSEECAQQLHDLSRRLHPAILELVGLKAALLDECGRWSAAQNVPVDSIIENLPESLPQEVSLGLYRVAQEALQNTAKHAKAASVRLHLSMRDRAILLSVEDDGQGFDIRKQTEGLGLITMAERIRAVRGTFRVKSGPGHGTTVEAEIPLK